jgi:arabinose-5-phosphate isomerase
MSRAMASERAALVDGTLRAEAAAVVSVVGSVEEALAAAADLILETPGHVLVAGVGTSHAVALRLAHLLACCGTPAVFVHPGDAVHGGAGSVTERDVVVVISKGGESADVNAFAAIAHERGARIVAFTEAPASTLGRCADHIVEVHAPAHVDPYGMIATGSSLVNAAVGDALCLLLLQARGYSREDFGRTHPGGAVGRRLAAMGGDAPRPDPVHPSHAARRKSGTCSA